jgi:hypothetical protein
MGPGATCPDNPPPPPGLKVLHGIAHPDLQAWASSIVHDPTTTFGQIFETVFGDKAVTARVEHHSWTTHGAQIVPGCYKGVTLYEPRHMDAATGAEEDDQDPPDDTHFFPLGGGEWIGFPSGETLDNEDLPYEPMDPNVAVASGGVNFVGQLVDIPAAPSPFMQPPVTQDEAFAAASQLSSMFPNIRSIVAQAPDGFYVRVITLGGGGLGFGGLGSLFGDKGLRRQPAGRGSDWGDVLRTMNRLPSQLGRVRVQIDRLVSSDFAVSGESGEDASIDEARAAQDQLRADLIDRCKCVLNWMRGVGLGHVQSGYSVILLVDGSRMSAEALEMVPPFVGSVPVRVRDIGIGPVPRFMEIVAP